MRRGCRVFGAPQRLCHSIWVVAQRPRALLVAAVFALAAIAGCSGGGDADSDPKELLATAKEKLDAASSVRFVLTSANVPEGSASLIGGEGVLARPAKFRGDLRVSIGSTTAEVSVISVGGTVYAKLPFASAYAKTEPTRFGIGDPGALMDPDTGLSTLLVKARKLELADRARIGKEVVQEVKGQVPGQLVADLLVTADASKPVAAVFAVTEKTGEVRRVVLTGPFFREGVNSTLTVVLDRYSEKVSITAPDVAS